MASCSTLSIQPALSYWVVAFLDMLGYRKTIQRADLFPIPTAQHERVLRDLARMRRFRRRLLGGIEEYTDGQIPDDLKDLSHLTPEHREAVERSRKIRLIKTSGADHIVLACSLAPDSEHFPMSGLNLMLHAAAFATLYQLVLGGDDPDDTLPLRGGIDVAAGLWVPEDDHLYSAAVANAYELESKRADTPRVLVSKRVGGVADSNIAVDSDLSLIRDAARHHARYVRGILFVDRDGETALDFFGEQFRRTVDDPEHAQSMGAAAWRFVRESERRFQGHDDHIAVKYTRLAEYMLPRLGLWGVKP